MGNRIWLRCSLLVVVLLVAGCSVPFKKIPRPDLLPRPSAYYAIPPDANLSLAGETKVFDTLLYSRKLNGGLNAQVVGCDRFIVVPTYNERIYLLNPSTGKEITSLQTESSLGSAAAIAGELLYFVEEAGGDRLTCFNLANRKTVFRKKIADSPGAPVIDRNDIYLSSRFGKVHRLDRLKGDSVWSYDSREQIYCSPTVDSAHVYFGTDRGQIICLEKSTGKKLWSFKAGGAIYARPVIGKYLYCPSGDGILYALDFSTGTLIWSFTTLGSIHTTPVLTDGRLLFGSDDMSVYCLDPQSGATKWSYETDGIIQSSPLATAASFIVCNSAGGVYQLDYSGNLLKSTRVKGSVVASPTVIGGRLYVVTRSRMLYCFSSTGSSATKP
ncbi:MAG: PQQ-binding-like beta-propeller repeat protein [candidate division Zixibacteria bacterium]|nr:PQQ-binding-like beta-propeller repeat protein [candidate division Zixibacteria bacterium]